MPDMDNLMTSQEVVKLIKPEMSLHAFRKAAASQKELREARVKVHDSLYLYDKDKVLEWAKTAKRRRRQPRS
jgi:hypothetical protein